MICDMEYDYIAARKADDLARLARWEAENPEYAKACAKQRIQRYCERHPERRKATYRLYRERHPEKIQSWARARIKSGRAAAATKRYNLSHPETKRLWRKNNPEKMRAQWSAQQKRRYATNPQFRLKKACQSRVNKAFKSQGARMPASTSKLLGCAWPELKAHIESQFLPGMTWENRGAVWHVDHVKPIARFDLTDPAQVLACFNFKNLSPLWKSDNLRKGAKQEVSACDKAQSGMATFQS